MTTKAGEKRTSRTTRRAGRQAPLRALKSVTLFAACSDGEIEAVESLLTNVRVEAGEVLMNEGAIGRQFMIIEDGFARVTRNRVELAILGPGSFFGEMALIGRQRRGATVTAIGPMSIDVLNRGEFQALLETSPSVHQRVMRAAADRAVDDES
jgi:CRP-like cAMP-binding protein